MYLFRSNTSAAESALRLGFFLVAVWSVSPAFAQGVGTPAPQGGPAIAPGLGVAAVNTYPNEHYYLGLRQYRDGELGNAAMAFDLALGRTRKDPSGRWIDAIPVLAMISECLYAAGDLPGAVENIDSALEIAIRNRGWLAALDWSDLATAPQRSPDPAAGWTAPNVPQLVPVPNRMSISSGQVNLAPVLARGGVLESANMTRIDAVEVMRGLAIALYRRGVIFGEISGEFEVANQTLAATKYPSRMELPVGRALIGAIRGCGKFAAGDGDALASDIGSYAALGNRVHPLSPILQLAGARYLAMQDQPAPALALATRAASGASALGHPEWVGEALMVAAGCVEPGASAAGLQATAAAAATAHQRRGRLAALGSLAAAADAALTAGDVGSATTLLSQLRSALSQRDRVQPRLAAHAEYLTAVSAAAGGGAFGDAAIDEAITRVLAFAQGNVPGLRRGASARRGRGNAAATPRLFQIGFVGADAQGRGMAGRAVEKRIASYLDQPSPGVWRSDPVDALAALSFDPSGLLAGQLLASAKQGKAEETLLHADAVLRQRFLATLPLRGRVQQIRHLVSTEKARLLPTAATWLEKPPAKVAAMLQAVALPRPPVGSAEAVARGNQLESLAAQIALSRGTLPMVTPHPVVDETAAGRLPTGTGLLTLVDLDAAIICTLHAGKESHVWAVPSGRGVANEIIKVLRGIGASGRPAASRLDDSESWKGDAASLRRRLIPNEQLDAFAGIDQLLIVPSGPLWYLPFELLPMGDQNAPLLGDTLSLRYATTPGLALYPSRPAQPELAIGTAAQLFFAVRDRDLNSQLMENVVSAVERHQSLAAGAPVPSGQIGDAIGFFAALGAITPNTSAPLMTSVSLFDKNVQTAPLAAWLRFPGQPAAGIFLPGYRTSAVAGQLGDGRELFMTLTALQVAGVRDVVISRWPVGGESTAILTKEFLQELPFAGVEPAWRRAVQTLRRSSLNPDSEPLLGNKDQKRDELTGDHPLFWAGYLIASPLEPK